MRNLRRRLLLGAGLVLFAAGAAIISAGLVGERISVDAPVVEMGLDGNGVPQVPLNRQDVAWYNFSAKPGAGSNAVFAGHLNWGGVVGVFGNIDELESGDTIRLISDQGREFTYEVFANYSV